MKKTLTWMALFVILVCGIDAGRYAFEHDPDMYSGFNQDVVSLYNNPDVYDLEHVEGVEDVIIAENLQKTMAANNVAAVVFDFRGFDTMGESFILLTAIAGCFTILGKASLFGTIPDKKKKEEAKA